MLPRSSHVQKREYKVDNVKKSVNGKSILSQQMNDEDDTLKSPERENERSDV